MTRKSYPSDVADDQWTFVAPSLILMKEDAPQREHELREVFNSLRWIMRTGSPWRYMPTPGSRSAAVAHGVSAIPAMVVSGRV